MPAVGATDLFDPAALDGAVSGVLAAAAPVLLIIPAAPFSRGGTVRAQHVPGVIRDEDQGLDLSRHEERAHEFGGTVHDVRL